MKSARLLISDPTRKPRALIEFESRFDEAALVLSSEVDSPRAVSVSVEESLELPEDPVVLPEDPLELPEDPLGPPGDPFELPV